MVRNNQEVVSAWGDTNGYQSASNSAILALNQGDRVYLVLQEGNRRPETLRCGSNTRLRQAHHVAGGEARVNELHRFQAPSHAREIGQVHLLLQER